MYKSILRKPQNINSHLSSIATIHWFVSHLYFILDYITYIYFLSILARIIWPKVSIALNFDQLSLLTRTYIYIYIWVYEKKEFHRWYESFCWVFNFLVEYSVSIFWFPNFCGQQYKMSHFTQHEFSINFTDVEVALLSLPSQILCFKVPH